MNKPDELVRYTAAAMVQAVREAPPDYSVLICSHSRTYITDYVKWTFEMAVQIDHQARVVRIWCETA